MQQFLLAIILTLGFTSYYLYNQNKVLTANNIILENAIATQEEAIASIQADFVLQTTQMNELTLKSQAAEREMKRYTQFIQNYELASKILADPIEMERKINNELQNILWKKSRNLAVQLTLLIMVCSCSLIPTKQIEVTAKPLERMIVQPVMPREINLQEPMWIVITPDNWEDKLAMIEEQEGELVFLAMTIPDYEVMAYNMQELKRYINELKEVVVYYKTVTTNTEE